MRDLKGVAIVLTITAARDTDTAENMRNLEMNQCIVSFWIQNQPISVSLTYTTSLPDQTDNVNKKEENEKQDDQDLLVLLPRNAKRHGFFT